MRLIDLTKFDGLSLVEALRHDEAVREALGIDPDRATWTLPCVLCGAIVTRSNAHHTLVDVRGHRYACQRVWAFCSADCRLMWWLEGGGPWAEPEIRTPATGSGVPDGSGASFFWSAPGRAEWQPEWADLEWDHDLAVIVCEASAADALRYRSWNPLGFREHVFHDINEHRVLLRPELVVEQYVVSAPPGFLSWWHAPRSLEEHRTIRTTCRIAQTAA